MKKIYLFTILFFALRLSHAQQTIPFTDNFEGALNWTIVNGTLPNQWHVDTATYASSNHSIYVSDAGGVTNTYDISQNAASHFYADFISTTGGCILLEFDWKNVGESGYDYLTVWKTNTSYVPFAGINIIPNPFRQLIGGPYSSSNTYTHSAINFNAGVNDTVRLVFSWQNDNSAGTQPPASVDNITITSTPGPINDVPCFATPLAFNTAILDSNLCTSNFDEPTSPACFINSNAAEINTVWYSFVAPASGCVKIKTQTGSLYDTQIALYGGTTSPVMCNAGAALNYIACNQNFQSCGGATMQTSELSVDSLTPSNYYYIMVDGTSSLTGTFSILMVDGGANCQNTFPPVYGQDCALPIPVCTDSILVPDPGYAGYGNVCDFFSQYCLLTGERGSSWYKITIALAGQLLFDIIPNDHLSFVTDYDFAIWKMDSAGGSVTCFQISADTIPTAACNFNSLGITGCYTGGNSPPAHPGYDQAYEPPINVLPGEIYYLVVQNYAFSGSGNMISFTNTAPGVIDFCPVGTNTMSDDDFYFTIFPNPITNQSTIKYSLHKNATVQLDVMDVLGKKIKSIAAENKIVGTHSITLNKSEFANGIYLVRLVVNGKTFVKRIAVH